MNAGVCEAGARAALYRAVEETVRPALGLDAPIRWPALRQSLRGRRIDLIEHHFDSDRILGVLVRGVGDGRSAIVLRADRSETSRKFILCHELIHYFLHPGRERTLCRADRQEEIADPELKPYYRQSKYHCPDYISTIGAGFNSVFDLLSEQVLRTQSLTDLTGLPFTEEPKRAKEWDSYLELARQVEAFLRADGLR